MLVMMLNYMTVILPLVRLVLCILLFVVMCVGCGVVNVVVVFTYCP